MSQLAELYAMLQRAVSTGSGAVQCLIGCRNHTIYVTWGAGVTAGVIEVESAPNKDFTGTWAAVTTISWTAANKVDQWRGSGAFGALRTRFSTDASGGTAVATTEYYAN